MGHAVDAAHLVDDAIGDAAEEGQPALVGPAREDKIVKCPAPALQPFQDARPRWLEQNCTGLPVFCWTVMARGLTRPPLTRSPMRTLTRSQPRSLLSIARSKSARSRSLRSRSSQNRTAHTCLGFRGRFAPGFRPAFQAGRSLTGPGCECPIRGLLFGLERPKGRQGLPSRRGNLAESSPSVFGGNRLNAALGARSFRNPRKTPAAKPRRVAGRPQTFGASLIGMA